MPATLTTEITERLGASYETDQDGGVRWTCSTCDEQGPWYYPSHAQDRAENSFATHWRVEHATMELALHCGCYGAAKSDGGHRAGAPVQVVGHTLRGYLVVRTAYGCSHELFAATRLTAVEGATQPEWVAEWVGGRR